MTLAQYITTKCCRLLCISRVLIPVLVCRLALLCFSLITGVSALLSTQDTTEIRSTNTSVTTRACPTTRSLCTPSTKGSKGHFLTRRSSSIWNFMPTEGLSKCFNLMGTSYKPYVAEVFMYFTLPVCLCVVYQQSSIGMPQSKSCLELCHLALSGSILLLWGFHLLSLFFFPIYLFFNL